MLGKLDQFSIDLNLVAHVLKLVGLGLSGRIELVVLQEHAELPQLVDTSLTSGSEPVATV